MKKINMEYELFKKKFSEETGLNNDIKIVAIMKQLKRAEGKLHRMYIKECNIGEIDEIAEKQTQDSVIHLLRHFRTISVKFNTDPRGGAIKLVFKKTGWINTLGSDVAVDW